MNKQVFFLKMREKLFRGVTAAALFFLSSVSARSQSTNIADAYRNLGFNPAAANCGVLLQISDIHMALSTTELALGTIVTNIDPRLVTMVKAISPQPTAMIVTGDLCTAGAPAFGNHDYEPIATNELVLAQNTLKQFTNFPVYIIPGNHDNPAYEMTNSPLFNSIFTNTPRFTNFTIAGLPVLALAGHGGGWLDPEEKAWMSQFRESLDHTKPVLVAIHQPLFSAYGEDARESRRDIMWFFKPWTAPVWLMTGHAHIRDAGRYPLGMTTVTEYICPSAQNWLIPTSNPLLPSACGFYLWCITNGTVAGVIEGVLTNQTYYQVGLPIYTTKLPALYDGVTNVLFLAEEGHFNRSNYNVSVTGGWDVTYWRSYVTTYGGQLPMAKYPTANRLFLIGNPADQTSFYLGTNTNSWVSVPVESYTNDIISVIIPPNLRTNSLWFMASNSVTQFFVGGFGLGTTNAITDFQAWAGVTVGDSTIQPTAVLTNAGDIAAWDAYLFGLDATHIETMREMVNYPFVGSLPHIGPGLMRFGARTNTSPAILQSTSVNGPWAAVTNLHLSITTNGWNEYVISNSAPSGFYKIGASGQ